MKFILLFVALNQTPAQLGTYQTLEECRSAILQIYIRQSTPQGVQLDQRSTALIRQGAEAQAKYDTRYLCQPVS